MTAVPADRQRGAALLIVLVFSALLAGLAAVAMRGAASGAKAAAVFLDGMRAEAVAHGIADAVSYRINAGGPEGKRGGAFTIHLGQTDLDVDYLSESARVDVNKAPVELIAALLAAAGADAPLVAAVTGRIASSRTSGQAPVPPLSPAAFGSGSPLDGGGAGLAAAVAALAPKPPSTGPRIQRTLEVVQAWGLPESLARRVLPALTVANGAATVDPVLADHLVLSALMGGADERIDDYMERRRTGFADTGAAKALLPIESQAFAGFTDVSAVRAVGRVTVARRFVRSYEVVLDPPAFPGEAPRIFSWQPLF